MHAPLPVDGAAAARYGRGDERTPHPHVKRFPGHGLPRGHHVPVEALAGRHEPQSSDCKHAPSPPANLMSERATRACAHTGQTRWRVDAEAAARAVRWVLAGSAQHVAGFGFVDVALRVLRE